LQSEIYEYLGFTHYTQGNLRKALKYTNELLKLVPDHPRAIGNKVYYEDKLKDQTTEEKRKGSQQNKDVENPLFPSIFLLGEDGFVDDTDEEVTVAEEVDHSSTRGEEHELYMQLCRGEKLHFTKFVLNPIEIIQTFFM